MNPTDKLVRNCGRGVLRRQEVPDKGPQSRLSFPVPVFQAIVWGKGVPEYLKAVIVGGRRLIRRWPERGESLWVEMVMTSFVFAVS